MSTMSFNGLLIISAIAVAAPILAASVRRVKLPSVVMEIVAGFIVGSSVLGSVRIDQPVNAVALLGLAFCRIGTAAEIADGPHRAVRVSRFWRARWGSLAACCH